MADHTNVEPRRLSRRQLVSAATGAAILGNGGMLLIGADWSRELSRSRLTVLGSGDELSLFVTAGAARCLVAAGDKAADFADALGQCRYLTTRRIDVLLLLPSALAGGVADKAVAIAHGRYTARVGDVRLSAETAKFGAFPILASPRRIRLPDGVTLTVASALTPSATSSGAPTPVYQVVLRRSRTTIVLLSAAAAVHAFPRVRPVSAVICPAEAADEVMTAMRPGALILSTHSGKPAKPAPGASAAPSQVPRFLVRPGETLEMHVDAGRLRLTGQPPLPLGGSPAPEPAIPDNYRQSSIT